MEEQKRAVEGWLSLPGVRAGTGIPSGRVEQSYGSVGYLCPRSGPGLGSRVEKGCGSFGYLSLPRVRAGSVGLALPSAPGAPSPALSTCFLPFTLFSHNQDTYCIFQLTYEVV